MDLEAFFKERLDAPRGVSGVLPSGGAAVFRLMLPVLLFTVLVRRYLVSGLTAGGVKE